MANPLGTPDRVVQGIGGSGGSSNVVITDGQSNYTQDVSPDGFGSVALPDKVAIAVEKTRPANTDAYLAKDVIAQTGALIWNFNSVVRKIGGSGTIVGARLITDQKTNVAAYRVHLYRTSPTGIADNDPFLLLYANSVNRIGSIDIPNLATEDATNSTAAEGLNLFDRLPFVCDAAADDLFAIVETLTVFTPASGQKYTLEIVVERD